MSFLSTVPELVSAAAGDLSNIGSDLGAANAAAAASTRGVLAAGTDEVSAAIAQLFSGHAAAYQALAAQASNFHNQFVQLLSGGGAEYASARGQQRPGDRGRCHQRAVRRGSFSGARCMATAPTRQPGPDQPAKAAGSYSATAGTARRARRVMLAAPAGWAESSSVATGATVGRGWRASAGPAEARSSTVAAAPAGAAFSAAVPAAPPG